METQSIAKNLVYQRKLKGYTQEELSEKTQVTIRTIQRIEKGDVNPHLQTIKLLAAALNIEVDDLLVLENPKEEALLKKWLILLHGTPFLGFIIPLANILFPLFLWIHKREDNKIYDRHGIKIINFQITMTILYILSMVALLTIEKWGFLLFISVIPFSVIVMLFNIIKSLNSQKCYYPLSIPFISGKKRNLSIKMMVVLIGMVCLTSFSDRDNPNIIRLDGTEIVKDSLTRKINLLMENAKVPGMTVTVFNENKTVYQRSFGYRDFENKIKLNDSTNIYGASFSKAVFSVLVMKLVEEGVIDLDTPLESFLPKKIYEFKPETKWHDDYSALKNDSLYHKITARMCLNHTTGFANSRWFESDYQLRVNREPGTRYSYSGEGFIYLQVVLEKLLGKNLEELAQQKIFKPLKMNHTSYKWLSRFEENFAYGHNTLGEKYIKDKDNEPRGGGTLETTSEDYSTFLEAVLQHKIISKTSWDELFRPQIRIRSIKQFGPLALKDSTLNDHIQLSYGLGWGILQTPYGKGVFKEGHGNGFQHYSILFPKAKKGIMIMTNSDHGESIFKELLEFAIKDTYTPSEWENYIPYKKQ
ncbi:serine hydrolase [Maribacter sp. ANRC-HE7]|uniref:Serine hydrolase n=1 Tax=Maribacter aquimaris TaxID=2737171 RepID=A0ABR7V693_9FLAO|nr:serine hydrolase [Maribacter aquimaris]MBD0779977.1 serine hydrolase [Maribacter aquimaris]